MRRAVDSALVAPLDDAMRWFASESLLALPFVPHPQTQARTPSAEIPLSQTVIALRICPLALKTVGLPNRKPSPPFPVLGSKVSSCVFCLVYFWVDLRESMPRNIYDCGRHRHGRLRPMASGVTRGSGKAPKYRGYSWATASPYRARAGEGRGTPSGAAKKQSTHVSENSKMGEDSWKLGRSRRQALPPRPSYPITAVLCDSR